MKPTPKAFASRLAPLRNKPWRVCHDSLDFIQVPGYPSAIETRSLPTLTRSYPRRFAFYVAWPAAPFARLTHSRRNVVQR